MPLQRVIDALEARVLLAGSIRGTVWNDANRNGLIDAGDSGLAGQFVYVDQNNDSTFNQVGTGGSNYVSSPVADLATSTSALSISGIAGRIVDLNVRLSLTHYGIHDPDVSLISPAGTRVKLLSDLPMIYSTGLNSTMLDDEALVSIANTPSAQYGIYRPQEALSAFAR